MEKALLAPLATYKFLEEVIAKVIIVMLLVIYKREITNLIAKRVI
jgi:hypothetical protein